MKIRRTDAKVTAGDHHHLSKPTREPRTSCETRLKLDPGESRTVRYAGTPEVNCRESFQAKKLHTSGGIPPSVYCSAQVFVSLLFTLLSFRAYPVITSRLKPFRFTVHFFHSPANQNGHPTPYRQNDGLFRQRTHPQHDPSTFSRTI